MRLTLRVLAYNSCCNSSYPNNTNIEIPDWVRAAPGASTNYSAPPNGTTPGVTQVVPNWNDPTYLSAFGDLLAALGRRYDSDERLSVFEFSGLRGFQREPHRLSARHAGRAGSRARRQRRGAGILQPVPGPEHHQGVHSAAGRGERQRFPPHPIGGQSGQPGDHARTARRRRHQEARCAGRHPLGLPRRPGTVAGLGRVQRVSVRAIQRRASSARSSSGLPRRW